MRSRAPKLYHASRRDSDESFEFFRHKDVQWPSIAFNVAVFAVRMTDSQSIQLRTLRRNVNVDTASSDIGVDITDIRVSNDKEPSQSGSGVPERPRSQAADESSVSITRNTETVEEQWKPTRTHQVLLLAAGFGMIFQTIGINSIYGIFQVRKLADFIKRSSTLQTNSTCVRLSRNSTHQIDPT